MNEFPKTTTKVRNGYTVTVTQMNEPSEEAILEFRKAITKLILDDEANLNDEDKRQSKEG